LPAKKSPRRVGGAPFTAVPLHRRMGPHPHSARGEPLKPAIGGKGGARQQMPSSAREDGTQYAGRAEQYICQLVGAPWPSEPADGRDPRSCPQEWALVEQLDAVDASAREDLQRQRIREQNFKNVAEIQAQRANQRRAAEESKELWRVWRNELEEDARAYKREEEMKRASNLEMQRRFNEERARQLEEMRRRKATQREADAKFEQEIFLQAEAEKRKEESLVEMRKQAQKKANLQMAEEARKAQERRIESKKREHEADLENVRMEQEMLDQQERQRNDYFDRLREKQTKLMAQYEKGVSDELARLERLDADRARREQLSKEEKDRKNVEAQEQWRQSLRQNSRNAVNEQLKAQALERQRLKEEELSYAEHQRRHDEAEEAKDRDAKFARKQAVRANAEFLREQIRERSEKIPWKKAREHMNPVEMSMNRNQVNRAMDLNRSDGFKLLLKKKKDEYRTCQTAMK